MKNREFNTISKLQESKTESKTESFISKAKSFLTEALKLAENDSSFITKMTLKEIDTYVSKAVAADCEYTAYANAHSAEVWLEQMVTRSIKLNN